jgi:glutathione peroxidase
MRLSLSVPFLLIALLPSWAAAQAAAAACPAVLQHTQPRLQDEKPVNLCGYAGQVVLVVNTASFCGYTGQYKSLEALHSTYGPRGLVVLGFPSNDFGGQEPGTAKQIADFCENTFGVKFPMFAKSHVAPGAGRTVNPLFVALAQRSGAGRPGISTSTWSAARRCGDQPRLGRRPERPGVCEGLGETTEDKVRLTSHT